MDANIKKLKKCFHAVGLFLKNMLTVKFSLWVFIVVFLVYVLSVVLFSCASAKSGVQTALVGVTEYRGHTFLVFRAVDNQAGTFSVVHDPDCRCNLYEPIPNQLLWDF